MAEEDFSLELERALRRVRSTGDLDFEPASARASRIRNPRTENRPPRDLRSTRTGSLQDAPPTLRIPPAALTRDVGTRGHRASTDQHNGGMLQFPDLDPMAPRRRRPARPVPNGLRGKFLVFFGLAGPDAKVRNDLITVIWKLAWGLLQFVVIITVLVFASKRQSPTMPGVTEWNACPKPLGVWNAVWLGRVALGCLLWYWEWRRSLVLRQMEDEESSAGTTDGAGGSHQSTSGLQNQPESTQMQQTRLEARLPNNDAFRRLTIVTNLFSMTWFLTAHVFAYSTVNTCRHSAPFLWWLMFGILCILYLMLLEIFLIGLLIFILGPVIYLFYNIVLLCLGRHPLQRGDQIRADIKKIPKAVVDQIPLVLYIPSPTEEETGKDGASPITIPDATLSYPPKPPKKTAVRRRRFAFLRRSKKSSAGKKAGGVGGQDDENTTWEDNWMPGDYPFVRLEGHRAICAICLMDFDEPERVNKGQEDGADEKKADPGTSPIMPNPTSGEALAQEVQVEELTRADAERLQLEDAGEGAQPLRLLPCGHVFHKTCIDPWLTDVSGRCPVCQRPIEIPEDSKKKRRSRRTPS